MKRYTIQQVTTKPTLFDKPPFEITRYGRVIGTFIKDDRPWYKCEDCGDPTDDKIKFENEKGNWEALSLCAECKKKLL